MRYVTFTFAFVAISCTSSAPQVAPTPTTPSPTPSLTTEPTPTGETTPSPLPTQVPLGKPVFEEFDLPAGSRPHDVAPAPDGRVWYTAQGSGELGLLDPRNGRVRRVDLGDGARPHGVIVGPDGDAWVTDSGLNQIIRVDAETFEIERFTLPGSSANLNTAAFDGDGVLWFTGQNGNYGLVNPRNDAVRVFNAPRGRGPYGIAATPDGTVWFSSLAGSYIARVDGRDGRLEVVDVPTSGGGARRVWSDSGGRLWVTEWFTGKLARYTPSTGGWHEWDIPGNAQPYAVFVDEHDLVWVTDFGANALVRFDPRTERFRSFRFPSAGAEVRQLLGRPGEVWGAESGTDKLVVARTGS
ncbi:MAG TPA: lyase [Actinomycetota bacterium]